MTETISRRGILQRAAVCSASVLAATILPVGGVQAASQPITAARFSITIDGYEIASFSELASEFLSKLPGKRKPPTVVLKRGKNTGMGLFAWHEAARTGLAEARKNAHLVGYNAAGEPVARYYLENAWPSKVDISALTAGSIETLTLTCEDIQRIAI